MQRRKFIKTLTIAGLSLPLAGATALTVWLNTEPTADDLTTESARAFLANIEQLLRNGQLIETTGNWQLSQILTHCAQSIEYSMTGYPEHKSQVFKTTAGALAFSIFARNGSMTHNLSEAIPGASKLPINHSQIDASILADNIVALERLQIALLSFDNYTGVLKEHFAYGELSKLDYEKAHVMHLRDHFTELLVG